MIVAAAITSTGVALADDVPRLDVEQGKKVETNVGYAQGWMCDDPSLLRADLVTRKDTNFWIVTGVRLGKTMCRIGTANPYGVQYLFEVHIVPPKKK